MNIPKKDLRITMEKGSGPGGQNVNKRCTAVRIVHLPTGTEGYAHERSQATSRRVAMEILVSKLQGAKDAAEATKKKAERDAKLASTVRVRTYDFTSGRVFDHRGDVKSVLKAIIRKGRLELE